MKRNFVLTLLLLSMLCVVTTGCGSRKDNTANSTVQDTMQSPTQNSPQNGTSNNSDSLMDDVEQGLENTGDAIMGDDTYNDAANTPGVPYNDLLGDGTVTDRDGNLNNDVPAAKNRKR